MIALLRKLCTKKLEGFHSFSRSRRPLLVAQHCNPRPLSTKYTVCVPTSRSCIFTVAAVKHQPCVSLWLVCLYLASQHPIHRLLPMPQLAPRPVFTACLFNENGWFVANVYSLQVLYCTHLFVRMFSHVSHELVSAVGCVQAHGSMQGMGVASFGQSFRVYL